MVVVAVAVTVAVVVVVLVVVVVVVVVPTVEDVLAATDGANDSAPGLDGIH